MLPLAAVVGSITMCAIKSWLKSQRFQWLTKEKVRSSHLFYLVGFPLPATQVNVLSIYASKVARCEGLGIIPRHFDNLLLHHDDDLPGGDGEDVDAAPLVKLESLQLRHWSTHPDSQQGKMMMM